MFEESKELEAIREMWSKVEVINRKVDWLAGLAIGATTLFVLHLLRDTALQVFGSSYQTIVDIISGLGIFVIPALLSQWYDAHATRDKK